jgi:hypothetical protein
VALDSTRVHVVSTWGGGAGGGGGADPLVVHPWSGVTSIVDETGSPRLIVGADLDDMNLAYATAVFGNDTPAFDLSAVLAYSGSGVGVTGNSTSGKGVRGFATTGIGVYGVTVGSGVAGVEGDHFGSGPGVKASSTSGPAIHAAGYVFLANHAEPATPSGGGVLYVEGGSLKYKGSSGTVTTLGPARWSRPPGPNPSRPPPCRSCPCAAGAAGALWPKSPPGRACGSSATATPGRCIARARNKPLTKRAKVR